MIPFPDIDPVALSIGPLVIRWYALAYLAGFLLGGIYAAWLVKAQPQHRPNKSDLEDFLPWAVLGVILGGRIGYVLFYQFAYYLQNPAEILQVWHGGMSFHGGALGVIIALLVYAWRSKIELFRLTDPVCAAVPIGLFFGRIANFINGELFGRTTNGPWGVIFPNGGELPRHPSQLYEAVLEGLVLFAVLLFLSRSKIGQKMPGLVTGVFLCGYALARFVVEYVREPDLHLGLIGGFISMGQILCVPMFLFGLFILAVAWKRRSISA